jgi:hypothetical protein
MTNSDYRFQNIQGRPRYQSTPAARAVNPAARPKQPVTMEDIDRYYRALGQKAPSGQAPTSAQRTQPRVNLNLLRRIMGWKVR